MAYESGSIQSKIMEKLSKKYVPEAKQSGYYEGSAQKKIQDKLDADLANANKNFKQSKQAAERSDYMDEDFDQIYDTHMENKRIADLASESVMADINKNDQIKDLEDLTGGIGEEGFGQNQTAPMYSPLNIGNSSLGGSGQAQMSSAEMFADVDNREQQKRLDDINSKMSYEQEKLNNITSTFGKPSTIEAPAPKSFWDTLAQAGSGLYRGTEMSNIYTPKQETLDKITAYNAGLSEKKVGELAQQKEAISPSGPSLFERNRQLIQQNIPSREPIAKQAVAPVATERAAPAAAPVRDMTQEALNRIERGYTEEANQAARIGNYQAAKLGEFERVREQQAQRKQDLYAEADRATQDYMRQKAADYDAYAAMEPKDFWADKTTGQKIAAAILVGIGAVGGAMAKGPNEAADRLDKIISDDIDRQKRNREFFKEKTGMKDTIYDLNLKRLGNIELAIDATKLDAQQKVLNQVEIMKARAASPIAKANLDKIMGKIQYDHQSLSQKHAAEISKNALEQFYKVQEERRKEAEAGRQEEELGMKRKEYFVPRYNQLATSKEDAQWLRTKGPDFDYTIKALNRLLDIGKISGKSASTKLRAEAGEFVSLLTGTMRESLVGPGTLNEQDWERLKEIIPNVAQLGTLDESNALKLKMILDKARSGYEGRAKDAGINLNMGREAEKQAAEKRLDRTPSV